MSPELPVLLTERLRLRAYTDDDAPRVLDIHSRMDVVRWLDNPPHILMTDLVDARDWMARWVRTRADDPRSGGWAVEIRDTGVVAGTALVAPLPHGEGRLQIGWHLHPDSTGRGYATESAEAVLAHAFASGVDMLWCDMFADNLPSARVARRLGMTDLGIVADPWYGGESQMFTMTAAEYEASRPSGTASSGRRRSAGRG